MPVSDRGRIADQGPARIARGVDEGVPAQLPGVGRGRRRGRRGGSVRRWFKGFNGTCSGICGNSPERVAAEHLSCHVKKANLIEAGLPGTGRT